jgi:hypothetical protein
VRLAPLIGPGNGSYVKDAGSDLASRLLRRAAASPFHHVAVNQPQAEPLKTTRSGRSTPAGVALSCYLQTVARRQKAFKTLEGVLKQDEVDAAFANISTHIGKRARVAYFLDIAFRACSVCG